MSPSKPSIFFVHGAYHPPQCYDAVTTLIKDAGYEVSMPRLASLGKDALGITVDDDVAVVRRIANELFEAGKEVVLVGHSYGGHVSAIAAKGLTTRDFKAQGKQGGFKGVVYLSGILAKQGGCAIDACNSAAITPPDVADIYDIQTIDGKTSATVRNTETAIRYFFSPAPKDEIEKTMALLEPQCPDVFYLPAPSSPADLSIPQTYVISEQDSMVLLESQERIVADWGMKTVRLENTGHAPFLNHPRRVAEAILEMAS
ncbi:hypothetical protein JX266_007476 [Neoarthrinium moseri]|nr:hypothetical protein JX266_007476 [Neoarthrinium moseri]